MERPDTTVPDLKQVLRDTDIPGIAEYIMHVRAERDGLREKLKAAKEAAECVNVLARRYEGYYEKTRADLAQARADAERLAERLIRASAAVALLAPVAEQGDE